MARRSSFVAPRVVTSFQEAQAALRDVQEALDAATMSRSKLKLYTSDFTLVAGSFHRASANGTLRARLPAASGENLADPIYLSLEGMNGTIEVWAAPGQTVNGGPTASFTVDGIIALWSNGLNAWSGISQVPAESPAGEALDADYVLGAAHASLPNGRVATASTEITPDIAAPNAISWALNTASVVLGKLANLTGLSVLGRAGTTTGAMAAITATAARQTLRNNDAGTALEWGHPVEVRDSAVDQGDAFALDFVAGANVNLAASVAAGVATITPSVDLSSVTYTAGDGLDLAANQFSVDVSDFAGTGIEDDGSNNLRIAAAAAGAGLVGGGGSALAVGAGTHITANANDVAVNVATLVPAIDGASVVANGSVLERAAMSGAIAVAQESNLTLFSGIQNGGAATTDRTNLNFIGFTVADDAGNDRINITASSAPAPVVQTFGTSGTSNDVSLNADTTILRVDTGNNAWRITGFARSGGNFNGDTIQIENASNTASIGGLQSQTGSVASNQIITPQNQERQGQRYSAKLVYDGTDGFWRVVSETGTESTDYAWVGSHSFTSATHTVNTTGDIRLESSADGVHIGAGHSTTVPVGDVLINASSGIAINASGSTATTGLLGFISLIADDEVRLTTPGGNLHIANDGAWDVDGDEGTAGEVLTSAGPSASPTWSTPPTRLRADSAFDADVSITITPPAGATWFEYEIVGGGGGGGGAAAATNLEACAGGGGASGEYIRGVIAIVSGNITGSIGGGGAGGLSSGGTGTSGTSTVLTYNATSHTAVGGGGGVGVSVGALSPVLVRQSIGGNGGSGATGGTAKFFFRGVRGSKGVMVSAAAIANTSAYGGDGAPGYFGGSAAGGAVQGAAGNQVGTAASTNGTGAGGGGAAALSTGVSQSNAGGTGAAGCMIVRFYGGAVPTFAAIT